MPMSTTTSHIDFTTMSDEHLAEGCDALAESYSETYSQYRGEIAAFGDAWPGSALQVAGLRADLAAYEAEWERRMALRPVHGPAYVPPVTDEEPF